MPAAKIVYRCFATGTHAETLGFVLPQFDQHIFSTSPSWPTYVLYVLKAPRVAVGLGRCRGEAQVRFDTERASCVGGVSTA